MKILLLVHDYLPEHAGGTEVHAHRLGASWRGAGVADRLERIYADARVRA